MVYPSAPWTLQGPAIATAHLIEIAAARLGIPPALDIIPVLPGRTAGGIYLASYGSGSILEYHELIVTSALVRYRNKVGAWISHIYVDQADSVAGGRAIWGLPKEMAEFDWHPASISVYQQGNHLCSLQFSETGIGMPGFMRPTLLGPVISRLESEWLIFQGTFQGQIQMMTGHLTISEGSPFAPLHLGQPGLTVHYPHLHLVAHSPEVIG